MIKEICGVHVHMIKEKVSQSKLHHNTTYISL